jgi:hypothetical protein
MHFQHLQKEMKREARRRYERKRTEMGLLLLQENSKAQKRWTTSANQKSSNSVASHLSAKHVPAPVSVHHVFADRKLRAATAASSGTA